MRCTTLFPRGANPHKSWAMASGLPQKPPIETTVLRPVSSPRKTNRTRVCSGKTHWDMLGRGSHTARRPTKGTSLLRLASGVLRAASSVPWSGKLAGDGQASRSRDPQRGGKPPSSATFLGGRDWEKRSLETAAPWNTGRVSRPISWGHCGETGTGWCSVHRSSPEGPALKSPGPLATGRSSRRLSSENDGQQIRLRPGSATLTPKFWGVRKVTFLECGAGTRFGLLRPAVPA